MLGVRIQNVNAELAKEFKLDNIEGVYIAGTEEDGAAQAAGLKEGDVIISVNGITVKTSSELQEQISKHRPGDVVDILIKRDNKEKHFNVTLRNTSGGTGIVKDNYSVMGAELEKVNDTVKDKLHIRNGLKIKDLSNGKLKDAGIREGFIITGVNKTPVTSIDDLKEILKQSSGGVLIEGIYPNGEKAYYVFGLE
jgi:S1-C subfamily serine protease